MLEVINSLACAVLFAYCFVVAVYIPHRGMWVSRFIMCSVSWFLMAQIIGPAATWIPPAEWHSALLHASLAVALIVWRKEALHFIRCKFTIPKSSPRRRLTDWS